MSGPSIRAVIWDFGGVLVRTFDPNPRRAWEDRLGLAPGDLEKMVFRSEIAQAAALGAKTEDDVWEWVRGRVSLPPSAREALAAGFYGGDKLDDDLMSFVRSLRPAVRTGLLSNAFHSLRPALSDRFPIADAFDAIVISAEEGVMKPDRRIYEIVLRRLGVAADETIFVDDFEENCAGARALGMHAVRFESSHQARQAVEAILVDRGT